VNNELRGMEGGVTISKVMEKDILKKIAEKFAEVPFEDPEMFFELFLNMGESTNLNKISKAAFKDKVLLKYRIPGVNEKDLELLLKSHP
jgi:hypothetical protein